MFFQFPLLPGTGPNPSSGAGSGLNLDTINLEGLFADPETLMGGFSGELQALLMQLSPQVLQRLESMIAGGMTLPQAANRLLSEGGLGKVDDLFANLLKQGMPETSTDPELPLPKVRKTETTVTPQFGKLVEHLGLNAKEGDDWTRFLQTPLSAGGGILTMAPMTVGNQLVSQLPPQLAANLLHMGVPQAVAEKGWGQAIAQRVMWMVQGDQQFARLKLNPPNLGPLEVRVSVNQDQTSVNFIAAQPVVREALEAAMPRLREMFDQQSLQLVRADVSDPGARQGERSGEGGDGSRRAGIWGSGDDQGDVGAMPDQVRMLSDRLVDLFA